MRTIRLLVPVLAVLLPAPVADAKGAFGCVVVTDRTGDVEAVAGPTRTSVADAHVDIRGAAVYVGDRGGLLVTIYLDDVVEERRGTWRTTFVTRGKEAFVEGSTAAVDGTAGVWRAGLVGHPATAATGSIDVHLDAVRISAPASAFGDAAPRPRDVLSRFAVTAAERVAHTDPAVGLTDAAASETKYVAGRFCNHRLP